jgi:hypothetical protein
LNVKNHPNESCINFFLHIFFFGVKISFKKILQKRMKTQWILLVHLVLSFLVQHSKAVSLEIQDKSTQSFSVNGRLVQRTRVQVQCTGTGTGGEEWKAFTVIEPQSGGLLPRIRIVEMRCVEPSEEYLQFEEENLPLFTEDWRQKTCLTPYTQENMTTTREIYLPSGGSGTRRRLLSIQEWNEETTDPVEKEFWQKVDRLSPAQRKLLGLRPTLTCCGALGIGIDLACILPSSWSSFLGGCNSGGPDQTLTAMAEQMKNYNAFMSDQLKFNDVVRQTFAEQNQVNRRLQEQMDRNTESIGILNQQIPRIVDFQLALSQHMTQGFAETKENLQRVAKTLNVTGEAIVQLADATDEQFITLTRTTQGINQQISDLLITVWQIYVDTGMYRAVTREFYDNFEIPQVTQGIFNNYLWNDPEQIAYPFMIVNPQENRPRPETLGTLHTLKEAITVARTQLQFTAIANNRLYAYIYELNYKCDAQYLLDNSVPNIPIKVLLGRLGPDKCYPGSEDARWTCQCVVEVIPNKCNDPFPNDQLLFPWNFKQTTALNVPGVQNVCPGGASRLAATVLTRQTELPAFLDAAFCRRMGETIVSAPGAGDWAYRMIIQQSNFWNISNARGNPAGCLEVFNSLKGSNGLSNFLYNSWVTSYKAIAQTEIPQREKKIYGVLPSEDQGLQQTNIPWSFDPVFGQTQRCVLSRFTQVSYVKQKAYSLQRFQEFSGVEMRVKDDQGNFGDIIRVPDGVDSQPWLNSISQTLVTAVQLDVKGKGVIPASFRRVGTFYGEKVGSSQKAPPRVVFSFPVSQMSESQSAAGRCGSLNYVAQKILDTMTSLKMTLPDWMAYFKENFKSECAREQLWAYMKGIKEVNGRFECDTEVTESGNWRPIQKLHTWCQILKFYRIEEKFGVGGKIVSFIPWDYTLTAWVDFPSGTFETKLSSLCPSAKVDPLGGRALVTLTSSTPYPNIVYYSVTTEGCSGPAPTRKCSKCDVSREEVKLEPNVARTIDIKECAGEPLKFNVYTLDDSKPCYLTPLDVSSTANRSSIAVDTITLADSIREATSRSQDTIANAIVRQMNLNIEYKQQLDRIAAQSFSNRGELERKLLPVVRETTEIINRWITPNDTARAEEIQRISREETKRIADNIIKNQNASFDVWRSIARLDYLYNLTGVIWNSQNATLARIYAQQAVIDKALQEYLDSRKFDQKCDNIFGKIPIIGSLTCGVTDWFSDAFSWLKDKLKNGPFSWLTDTLWWIVGIVCFVGVIGCVIFCCCQCIGPCMAASKNSGDCSEGCKRSLNCCTCNYSSKAMPFAAEAAPDVLAYIEAARQAGVQADPESTKKFLNILKASQPSPATSSSSEKLASKSAPSFSFGGSGYGRGANSIKEV